MKISRKQFLLLVAGLSAAGLTACGGPDDTPADDDEEISDPAEGALTAEDFAENSTLWQGDDGSLLQIDLDSGEYTYRTWYGRKGVGTLIHEDGPLTIQYQSYTDGENSYYLIGEDEGFRIRHTSGSEDNEWGEMNGRFFVPAECTMEPFELGLLDGVWQNALGETLAFNTTRMRYISCSPGDETVAATMSSWPLYDYNGGCGPFMGGEELLFPCMTEDGNSFVLFSEGNEPRLPGAKSVGVYYRDGDAEFFMIPEDACFEEKTEDGSVWYHDGMNSYALPAGYTLQEDGQAYDQEGEVFPTDWYAWEDRYDPSTVWGENWMEENWGSNG